MFVNQNCFTPHDNLKIQVVAKKCSVYLQCGVYSYYSVNVDDLQCGVVIFFFEI